MMLGNQTNTNPLVRVVGVQQLLDAEQAKVPTPDEPVIQHESALAGHIRGAWQRNKLAKTKIDLKLLAALRARRGVYSADALAQLQAQGGLNIVWADLTETKCRAASAWIREIILPVGERPWGITPTPVPDLPRPTKLSIVEKAAAQAQATMQKIFQSGGGVLPPEEFRRMAAEMGEEIRAEVEREYKKRAARAAARMEAVIADRMAQGGWEQAIDAFSEDFVTYPAAILKGPIYRRQKELKWGPGYAPQVSDDPAQSWERVSPFDVYPAPSSRDCQHGDFIERIRFFRNDLFDLIGVPGYREPEIRKALRDFSNGHLEGWLWTEAERTRLEQESLYLWLSPPGVIDALSYWGSIPGWKLIAWGIERGDEIDPERDYEVNAVLIGPYVIYCAINSDPLGRRPYFKACYDEVPGAFWGRSVPELAETHQKMCNAIACAVADNLSIASGPQAWVHIDRLADGEQSLDVFPLKVWQLKSDPTQGVNPGVGFFQPNDNTTSLMALYEKWEIRCDDATGIPRYTYGNERVGGAADTATGLSMLLNNAAKGLRRAISNIDLHVIQPSVYCAFVNEMLYNPDASIKGDCVVIPRGAAAILIKESAQQRRQQALAITANPIDMQIIGAAGRAELLRETFRSMELPVDDIVPSADDILRKEQAAQAQAQAQQEQQAKMVERQQQAEVAKQQADEQRAAEAERAKGEREQSAMQMKLIGDIVKQAVSKALARKNLAADDAEIVSETDGADA